jgi:hypothetical protein
MGKTRLPHQLIMATHVNIERSVGSPASQYFARSPAFCQERWF